MKKIIWSIALLCSATGVFAQKAEVAEAKKKWGMYQIVMTQPTGKQLELLNGGLKNTDNAIANDKTKEVAETWAYRALFASSIAVVDTNNLDNAKKHKTIAEEAISKAIALKPTKGDQENIDISKENLDAYLRNTGILTFNRGNFKDALKIFQELAEANPQDTLMYANIALAASKAGEFPLAIENYKKSISMGAPDSKVYYQEIYLIYVNELKDSVAGLNIIQEASAKYPEEVYFIANETDLHMKSGNLEKAFALLDKLIAKNPTNVMYQRIKADTYFNLAFDAQEEVKKLEEAKKFKEADLAVKKKEEALKNALPVYLAIEKITPDDQELIRIIRNVYFALGNNEKADEYTKKIKN